MSDDRMNSDRNEFENQPQKRSKPEEKTNVSSLIGQRSRSQRHSGNHSSINEISDSIGTGPVKGAASKKESSEEWDDDGEKDHRFPTWARIMLWVLRKSIVPIIMLIMLVIGLYVGYVVLGKAPEDEVFDWSTWRHLYDLVFAES